MIPKAERDADAAILAAATGGTWITVPRTSQEGLMVACAGPVMASCEDARQATSIRVERPGSIGDMAHAEARMPWEQHVANAQAAAHAVNRLPEYIEAAAEMERRTQAVTEFAASRRTPYTLVNLNDAYNAGLRDASRLLRGDK